MATVMVKLGMMMVTVRMMTVLMCTGHDGAQLTLTRVATKLVATYGDDW